MGFVLLQKQIEARVIFDAKSPLNNERTFFKKNTPQIPFLLLISEGLNGLYLTIE